MSPAMSSHDERTMTSMPPIEPTRTVPGSPRPAGAPSPVLSATDPTYRTVPTRTRCRVLSVASLSVALMTTQELVGGRHMAQATVVDGVDVVGSLSPSRAGDFMTCPLLYRFRTVDKLPESSSPEAVRGTVVHKVLEELFDLPAWERTPERAAGMLEPAWEAVLAEDPEIAELFGPE